MVAKKDWEMVLMQEEKSNNLAMIVIEENCACTECFSVSWKQKKRRQIRSGN